MWTWATLDQLTCFVTSGSRGWAEYYSSTGPIFIRAANLNQDRLDLSDVAHVDVPNGSEGARTAVAKGDVLITITGANVTKTGRVEAELGEAYVSQHVALVRPSLPELSEYLYWWIISYGGGRGRLEAAAYGAGKPGLNLQNLLDLPVALPPLDEQRELLKQAIGAVAELDGSHSADAVTLRQSILAAAFRGDLVA
jgi:type I restriction enzyme S subunit